MGAPAQASDPAARQNFDVLFERIFMGAGDPNGRVYGPLGSIFLNSLGGAAATLWVKESAPTPATGWVAK